MSLFSSYFDRSPAQSRHRTAGGNDGSRLNRRPTWAVYLGLVAVIALAACGSSDGTPAEEGPKEWPCEIPQGAKPDYIQKTGCIADFQTVASQPLDASLPGALSGKVILDLRDNDAIYFQNSNEYDIHYK